MRVTVSYRFTDFLGGRWNFSFLLKLPKIKSIQSFNTQQEKCSEIKPFPRRETKISWGKGRWWDNSPTPWQCMCMDQTCILSNATSVSLYSQVAQSFRDQDEESDDTYGKSKDPQVTAKILLMILSLKLLMTSWEKTFQSRIWSLVRVQGYPVRSLAHPVQVPLQTWPWFLQLIRLKKPIFPLASGNQDNAYLGSLLNINRADVEKHEVADMQYVTPLLLTCVVIWTKHKPV